jgi:hypothetical protein
MMLCADYAQLLKTLRLTIVWRQQLMAAAKANSAT